MATGAAVVGGVGTGNAVDWVGLAISIADGVLDTDVGGGAVAAATAAGGEVDVALTAGGELADAGGVADLGG